MKTKIINAQDGFTIVELMIALTVLSMLLVATSFVMTEIGDLYMKGVNSANLQNTTRNVLTDITSTLKFSGSEPSPCTPAICTKVFGSETVNSFCIDKIRYSYVLDREQGTDPAAPSSDTPTYHVLWKDNASSGSQTCTPLDLSSSGTPPGSSNGYDLVPDHMRLTAFSVAESPPNSGTFTVSIGLAYGDGDLLCDSSIPGSCNSPTTVLPLNPGGTVLCKGSAGTQYCATDQSVTTVVRRLQ